MWPYHRGLLPTLTCHLAFAPLQSIDASDMKCVLDPKVTEDTIMNFRVEIGELWGQACGRNRGVFVLNPPDGNTYGM